MLLRGVDAALVLGGLRLKDMLMSSQSEPSVPCIPHEL